jgi:hypothetical protein
MAAKQAWSERTETVRAPTRERDALLATKRIVAQVNMVNVIVVVVVEES